MTSAKKKPSAKRTVKYAAKAQQSARQTASKGTSWVKASAADATAKWQQGAQDWAKQSAKLYQLPFAQADVDAATKQAADTMKSATENAVKMGNDFMQQVFGQAQQAKAQASSFDPSAAFKQFQSQIPQMPNFDMASLQDKFSAAAAEANEQVNKATQGATRAGAEAVEAARETIETLTEVCNVATRVSKEIGAEMISYCNKQFSQNVELSKQVLTCRTLNDMFDLATRITKANLDAFFTESVKLSEMVFQCATDVAEPLNECVSQTGDRITKAMSA